MKLKKIYTMMAGAAMMLAACSPDDFSFGDAQYSSDDLKCPDAYTVTIDGNYVTLESKLKGCTPLWVTPNGRSQEQKLTLGLPFAGDYEVTLGAETRAGVVYGEPYQFSLSQNDFAQLSDEMWVNLAGGVGKTKKWVPCNGNYGVGRCTGPVMYGNPDDVRNDGSGSTDLMFGSANWAPNWDPGFQSWLIPADDPYMSSYMEFGLDAKNGCTAVVFRNDANGGTMMNGKFNLNVSDKTHPVISFSDCYSLHNAAFDEVCSNYTQDVKIIECTPYLLQIATMRTNSEGPWWLIWNFVSQEVIDTNGECIPKEESGLIEKTEPELPTFSNLTTDLFTTEINGVTYVGSQMTYVINDETPYDWMWWNGSPAVSKWENVANGDYTTNWAPACGDEIGDFELVISRASDGSYNYECGEKSGKVTIADDKLTFDEEITILTASNDTRTVTVAGKEFTVLACEPGESVTIGVPSSNDENGNIDSYLCATLNFKKIETGATGPTVVPLNTNYGDEGISWTENGCVRLGFHHYGDGGIGIFKDAASVKLKKNQTIKVTFKLKPGVITWSKTPKCALIDNNIKKTWEPGCFDLDDAVTVNVDGETTVTLTNTTGSTQKFTSTCLDLSIQFDGFGEGDYTDMFESVTCVIE